MGPLRLLLDTHALYWWHRGDAALSSSAHAAIADSQNAKFVSAITAWEFVAKFRSGKQPEFAAIANDVAAVVDPSAWIYADHHASREVAANLAFHHRDATDRFIIGQAIAEDMTIVTADTAFASYSVRLL